ncbi:MAG: winged helix-turn-helix domain-containing protein [Prevotella sp.]
MKDNPKITGKELAAKCHITEDGVAYHIKKLKQLGKIKRKGGTRNGGFWEILQ